MTGQNGNRSGRGRDRWLVTGLWGASVLIVISGFVLRAFGSFLHRSDLRVTGVAFIACGVIVAVLGWLGEKLASTKPSNRA
jgi:hypothetical protein